MTPQDPHQYQPSWRKPAGILLILLMIAFWAWAVTMALEQMPTIPIWAQLIIYGVAGIVWIAPLRPVLMWMESGKWRE